jgi:hypothetical protein
VQSLTADQRRVAIILPEAPADIVTMNALKAEPLSPAGLKVSEMTEAQREKLVSLLGVYAQSMTAEIGSRRMASIHKAGMEHVTFAWAGGVEKGEKHYYRVQGPTFLIEYDNTQNGGNHVHSVWRDFDGDFGRDLLREHLNAVPHPDRR